MQQKVSCLQPLMFTKYFTYVMFLSEDRLMPFVFRWDGGGREVYLSGSFNDWEIDNILMATNR